MDKPLGAQVWFTAQMSAPGQDEALTQGNTTPLNVTREPVDPSPAGMTCMMADAATLARLGMGRRVCALTNKNRMKKRPIVCCAVHLGARKSFRMTSLA